MLPTTNIMELRFFKATPVLFCLLFLACGSDNGEGQDNSQPGGQWKIGSYEYSRGTGSQSRPPANDGQLFVIVCSTSGNGNLGEYSGSAVTCNFYDRGAGEYTIIDKATFNALINPTEKFICMDVSIGTATATGSVLYEAQSSTKKAVVSIEGNKYKVTVAEQIQVSKILDINGGIDGSAPGYTFTCNKIF